MRRFDRLFAVVLGAMCLPGGLAWASHTTFDYAIERVAVDGNLHGSADGVFDFVDEFDDGVLAPSFGVLWGTAFETGGALHVTSPGFHYSADGQPFTLDQSEAWSTVLLREGLGDETVRVVWRPGAIGTNHYVHASWFLSGGAGIGTVGIALTNYDAELAALFDPPQAPGLMMQAHAVRVYGAFTLETIVLDPRPVSYDSASGAIVMQLDYDDAARTVAVSYSLDGGTTFASPFTGPLPAIGFNGSGAGVGQLIVGADPYEVSPPPPPPACRFVVDKLVVNRLGAPLGDEVVNLSGHGYLLNATMNPIGEGVGVAIVDRSDSSALVLLAGSQGIPPGGPGTGCDPRDGWVAKGAGWAYRNRSGAFPPSCAPGSAGGVVSARVKPGRYGSTIVQVKVRNVAVDGLVGPIDIAIDRGGGSGPDPSQCYRMTEQNAVPCAVVSATRVKCPAY